MSMTGECVSNDVELAVTSLRGLVFVFAVRWLFESVMKADCLFIMTCIRIHARASVCFLIAGRIALRRINLETFTIAMRVDFSNLTPN